MSDDEVEILLVEDDDKDAKLAIRALQSAGVANRIQIVRDGEEALDFLFCRGPYESRSVENRPKLVLLDLKLPKLDGMQVLREIKSNAATCAIPVTVLTSSTEERDLVESYRLGVNSYIRKPVDFDQFRDAIKALGYYWLIVNQPPPPKTFAQNGPE